MSALAVCGHAQATEFNSSFLSIDGESALNLAQFSHADYTMPGTYLLDVSVNDQYFGRLSIDFVAGDEPDTSYACLPEALVSQFGLKPKLFETLPRTRDNTCVNIESIEGAKITYVKSSARLKISIPQVAFEYDDPNYIPRERWSDGIDGAMLDYRVIANTNRQLGTGYAGAQTNSLQTYGTVGANWGAWRFRGDYQAQTSSGGNATYGGADRNFQFNRLYAFRALPSIRSTVALGDNYLNSDIFDTFALTGVTMQSDDRMLPPSMRGYAPLITGVARTSATVTVSQQGRVLYATKVSPGAFALQDISANVQGTLDVTVQEEDGSEQKFTVTSAAVPFLARRGEIRYKAAVGRPRLFGGAGITPLFGFAEAAYGLPMDVTAYGGTIAASGYMSLAGGIGKDLGELGAVSVDVTTSRASLWWNGKTQSGQSYRFNYSKHFDTLDTDLRFFGYRFSDRTYTTFSQFSGDPTSYGLAGGKQRYSMTLAKRFWGVSTYLSYDHSSYWDREADDRFGLTLARTVSVGTLKNVSLNFSAFRNQSVTGSGNQVFVSATIPLGKRQTAAANVTSSSTGGVNVNAGFMGDNGDGLSYSVYGGTSDGRPSANANARLRTSSYQVSLQAATVVNTFAAASLEVDGSVVATRHGITPHANGANGDTRLLVSTDGVPNVALSGSQARTNSAGYAVIGSVSPFDAFDARVNVNKLALDTQVTNPVQRLVLTDGSIGYVHFEAARGRNLLVALTQSGGRVVPFGASVQDAKTGKEVGIVGERGVTYLTQVQKNSELTVHVGDTLLCRLGALPDDLQLEGAATPITCNPEAPIAGGS